MADHQIGNIHGVVDAQQSTPGQDQFNDADLVDIDAMRTRLANIDGTYYTSAKLNEMSVNDMVYAIRKNDHATTISE